MAKQPSNVEKVGGAESQDVLPETVNDNVVHRILSTLFSKRTGPIRRDEINDNAVHQALHVLYRKRK